MEKQNPTDPPPMERLPGTKDESHLPQPSSVSESPPRSEEGEEDLSAGRAPRWEAQWLRFLGRVKSREMLAEEALWGEAKVLLASLEPEPGACGGPGHEWAEQHAEVTLAVLPRELQSWLRGRGLQTCAQVVALAEASSWRQLESWRRECQVAAGSSSSAVWKNPPGLGQEEDGKQSIVVSLLLPAGLMPDSENEGEQPGMFLEREEQETLQGWERLRGPEEMMDELIPWLREAFEAQEQGTEGRGARSPGTRSSINAEGGPSSPLLPEEGVTQISTPGGGALGTADKPFLCLACGKSFTRRYNLTLHQRIHTGEKPYQCPDCSYRFADASTLRRHRRIHTGGKPYQCSECGKNFRHTKTLSDHQRIHTGERTYQCYECGMYFRGKETLVAHEHIHTVEKPYKCSECGKSFRRQEALVDHQRIHTGENPYPCSLCVKTFRHLQTFSDHQSVHASD